MTAPTPDERAQAAAIAALLGQARIVDGLSRPLTVAALLALFAPALTGQRWSAAVFVLLAVIALAGLLQSYLALRVRFDAALFARLAEGGAIPDLAALDRALTALGLLPAAKAGRPLGPRIAGARRLFRGQALAFAVQAALIVLGTLAAAEGQNVIGRATGATMAAIRRKNACMAASADRYWMAISPKRSR